jgi:hypothetical protein
VLGGYGCGTEHQAADDHGRQRVHAGGPPADGSSFGRQDVTGGASERPSQIDEDMQSEQPQPDHRRGPVQTARDLEPVPVQETHRHSAAEEDERRHDEQRREQSHRNLRWPVRDIGPAARVVAREAPAGGRQLQSDHRDEGEPDEYVPRHEAVDAEQDGRDLDDDGSEQHDSHRRRQPRVSVRVHVPHFSGTEIGPGSRR